MANIKSKKKRILTNEKSRQRNMAVRSRVKTMVKRFEEALESKDQEKIPAALKEAVSAVDRAVAKGVVHRNAGARKKSSLMHQSTAN
jgi:small subunit ribosomal protein S20